MTTSTNTPTPAHRTQRQFLVTSFAIAFIIIAILGLIYWLVWGRFSLFTDDAYVQGNIVPVMSQVSGTVVSINTIATQLVLEDQPLVELDKTDAAVAFQQAKANLAATVRQVRQYYENVFRAQANLAMRQADLNQAKLDYQRRFGLVEERAVSREEMQHILTTLLAAKSNYVIALHQLRSALALVDNTHLYAHPLVIQAKDRLKQAYLNYQRTTIRAPITGYVANRTVQVGQNIDTTEPLMAIIPLQEIWVDANYKESQIERIRINQPVILKSDAYPDVTYHGHIVGLTPGTGTSFALLPPQNATGNWIKILQRLPVRIHLDPDEIKANPLVIGLSMNVWTNTRHIQGKRLATAAAPAIYFKTSIYDNQLRAAHQLIQQILHQNASDIALPSSLGQGLKHG